MDLFLYFFATGDADPPASAHIEHSAGCARVRYSPTLQQQSSISAKGLNADFIIQYDVDLRDLMGEIQVRSISSFQAFKYTSLHVFHLTKMCILLNVFFSHLYIFVFPPFVRCMMATLCITLHQEGFLWYRRMLYLSLMSVDQ